jgi:hypothetical protein
VHFAYYQNSEIFLPRIIRIRKFSFHVLSEYGNFLIPRIISIHKISFRVISANAKFFLEWKIHSAYSQYELSFVPRIPTIVVGKLLLKSNCVTLLPLLLKETSYFESVTHFSL